MQIEAKNLCKDYKEFSLKNVNLVVEPNRTIGLVGPNGSGKTTLIHCLIGIEKPSSGHIEMDVSLKTLYRKIGVQPQDSSYHSKIKLYEMLDLILSNGDGDWNYVDGLLEKFNLLKKKRAYVSSLSGGEKQKFSLVVALANRPEILFLDEVTSNVDQINRKDIIQFLNELKQNGQSILMTSHYLDELESVCDYFVFLKDGEVLSQGTKSDLIKAFNITSKMQIEFTGKSEHSSKIVDLFETISFRNEHRVIGNLKDNIPTSTLKDVPGIIQYNEMSPNLEYMYEAVYR